MAAAVVDVLTKLQNGLEIIKKARINFGKCAKARLTHGYLQSRLECLNEYWASYRNDHSQLMVLSTKEQKANLPYFVEDTYSTCEDLYICLKADIMDMLNPVTTATSSSSKDSQDTVKMSEKGDVITEIKLPIPDLPKFYGSYEDWQSFEDSFSALVHNNKTLSNVRKLQLLKACVVGEAKTTIQQYTITDKNYLPAWENLKQRYSHKRLIVNSILKKLFSQKKMLTQSPSQLKTLVDNIKECMSSLNNIDVSTNSWDPIIIYFTVQKLDGDSHKQWERYVTDECADNLPTYTLFMSFLENNIRTLEMTQPTSVKENTTSRWQPKAVVKSVCHAAAASEKSCVLCKEDHYLCHCKEFGKMEPEQRSEFARNNHLCYNCLIPGHNIYACKQKTTCRICKKKHHSLLHHYNKMNHSQDTEKDNTTGMRALHANMDEEQEEIPIVAHSLEKRDMVLLATALLPVKNNATGQTTMLRALIDAGSQASFISERASQILKTKKIPAHGKVTGVGSTETTISHMVNIEIMSRHNTTFSMKVRAYVLSTQVTSKLPSKSIHKQPWTHLDGLDLADPTYFTPGKIDLLLGIDVYTEILKNNVIKGPPGTPTAQETSLGWILFGKLQDHSTNNIIVLHHHLELEIDNMLRSMWEIDMSEKRNLTADEKRCEEIFNNTHSRQDDGRYVVRLPFKTEQPMENIGETKSIALKRFQQLERKLERDPKLKKDYSEVIEDHLKQNFMEEVPKSEIHKPSVYLPHHAVVRDDKDTTKTRVVYDASCKGTRNASLNSQLLVGPKLQDDLRSILMRWRMKRICCVADCQKMYLQVLMSREDVDFHRILWRKDTQDDIKEYRLLRVTFGTASAPYLAVKTLFQVADDEGKDHPKARQIIREDFYVDDLISGFDTVTEAVKVSKQICEILRRGGFPLQKWSSNSTEYLQQIKQLHNVESTSTDNVEFHIKEDNTMKTLGITWNRESDKFQYKFILPTLSATITKRNILSDVARMYDPLGWIGPSIIMAKILIQRLWLLRLDWDEEVPEDIKQEWTELRDSFKHTEEVTLNRWLKTDSNNNKKVTIHGFSDASERAYAAVAFCRVEGDNGHIETSIIASKTRVAPVKTVCLPRLELCGSVLLARLLKQVRDAMRIPPENVFAWTDSSIVLAWLNGDPNRWKTFVSNRVVEILESTCNSQWFHVASEDNPADVASRGAHLPDLMDHHLWWTGPDWLRTKEIPFNKPTETTKLEMKTLPIQVNVKIESKDSLVKFEDYDNLQELLKTLVFSKRFLRSRKERENVDKPITTQELEEVLKICIMLAQAEEYKDEIDNLKIKRHIKKNSNIKTLNPYLDDDNIIRVGGRLRFANIDEDRKHPIILGHKSALTALIVKDAHSKTLHGGVQLMLCYLRSRYWIIRAKPIVKQHIHRCLICARHSATNRTQLMGDLPRERVTQARSFSCSGVDYAGPLHILTSKGRGVRTTKAYIVVFVCMATKAIHLELAGDMSSETFVGAFRRFVARRGRCTQLWSDQGRNFVAANKELAAAWKEASLDLPADVRSTLASDGTQWHFIPAYSPNFGGLWEAGVKSVKHHLKRILTRNLTFEEMTTLLCQIEACLNSRPLIPVDDTDVLTVLTPGHFLIGEAPMTIPSPDMTDTNPHHLSRWQHTQKLLSDFWRRWQTEYLSRLQQRPKWLRPTPDFDIGDIVLVKEEKLPPGKWCLGRIIGKHPGPDNISRVYKVKCRDNVITRSVSKLCPLPINKD